MKIIMKLFGETHVDTDDLDKLMDLMKLPLTLWIQKLPSRLLYHLKRKY